MNELKVPVESLLTPDSKTLFGLEKQGHIKDQYQSDSVPTHADRPAKIDELGRAAFAEALATRIRRLRSGDDGKTKLVGSFVVNIYGRWGSGKTSLLHFLREDLEKPSAGNKQEPGWVVVDFNAWRNQRIGPPWWAVMNSVFTQSRRNLWKNKKSRCVWLCLREFWWRAGMRRVLIFLGLAGVVVLGGVLNLWDWGFKLIFGETEKSTDMISGIATVSMLTLGAISAIWRWLRLGCPSRAHKFMEFSKDPMGPLVDHYNCLVKLIKRPIAVFIDDLDRCQVDYVVRLLEGIQTIFVDAPVVYVIASDRRWLCTSFETAYESFSKTVNEPGRPLGHFFLEKTFQMSFPVPRISDTAKKDYLNRLLRVTQEKTEQEIEDFKLDARQDMATAETEQEIQQRVEESKGTDREQFVRQAAVVKYAEQKIEKRTEHILVPFLDLMTPNPRAMKRLINAFGMNRTTSILAGIDLPTEQLVLWTILDLQWPVLAEYLEQNPEMIEHISAKKADLPEDIPAELRVLFADDDVRRVIKGDAEDVSAELDAVTIKEKCVLLRS